LPYVAFTVFSNGSYRSYPVYHTPYMFSDMIVYTFYTLRVFNTVHHAGGGGIYIFLGNWVTILKTLGITVFQAFITR
jgi:hypothetical protein